MTAHDGREFCGGKIRILLGPGFGSALNDFVIDGSQRIKVLHGIIESCAINHGKAGTRNIITFKSIYANLEVRVLFQEEGSIFIDGEKKLPSPEDFFEASFSSRHKRLQDNMEASLDRLFL